MSLLSGANINVMLAPQNDWKVFSHFLFSGTVHVRLVLLLYVFGRAHLWSHLGLELMDSVFKIWDYSDFTSFVSFGKFTFQRICPFHLNCQAYWHKVVYTILLLFHKCLRLCSDVLFSFILVIYVFAFFFSLISVARGFYQLYYSF